MNRSSKFMALLHSTHLMPSIAVAGLALLYGLSLNIDIGALVLIGLAVLSQQFSVGLSNDWLDYQRDIHVQRQDKPAVAGKVPIILVRNSAFISALISLALAFSLGIAAGLIMIPMLVIGWSYNLGLKSNGLSILPYVLGFGILPVFVSLSTDQPSLPPYWVVIVGALLGVSAHFANVLPDLLEDKETGVRALPHLLGQKLSAVIIAGTAILASLIVVTQGVELHPLLAYAGLAITVSLSLSASALALRVRPPRVIFPLLIWASLVNVILLLLS